MTKKVWFSAVALLATGITLSAQVGFKLNTANTVIEGDASKKTTVVREGDTSEVY
jgi:P pilus assembly chaperone PapD